MKIKYGKDIQIAASLGFNTGSVYTSAIIAGPIAAEIYYHFFGKSKIIDQPQWYLFGGLGYWWTGVENKGDIFFCPRLGRLFYFSKKTGINLDVGAFIPLSKELRRFFWDLPVWPSGSISFFIRL